MRVIFHYNVPNRLSYLVRLIHAIYAQTHGERPVVVWGEEGFQSVLDQALWTEGVPTQFLPHVWLKASSDVRVEAASPVILMSPNEKEAVGSDKKRIGQLPNHWQGYLPPKRGQALLINADSLGGIPWLSQSDLTEPFAVLSDMTTNDPADKQQGRVRWKNYQTLNWPMQAWDAGTYSAESEPPELDPE
jgi:DNA polymerase IIIc chi subunit